MTGLKKKHGKLYNHETQKNYLTTTNRYNHKPVQQGHIVYQSKAFGA